MIYGKDGDGMSTRKKTNSWVNWFSKSCFLGNKRYFLYFIILVAALTIFLLNSFAVLEPVSSVIVQSTTLDNTSKIAGSWKYTNSARWISKGKVRVNIKLETIEKSNAVNTDVILVLDTSGSIVEDKFIQLQSAILEFINETVAKDNKISIITFNDTANIITDFTNDSNLLERSISDLVITGETNYYQALVKVDEVLSNYEKKDNRDCVVLFLTDGLPTVETPSEVGEYKLLKDKYEYLSINGIQYELGDYVLDGIKNVTDIQYIASTKNLNEILYKASIAPAGYDNFVVTDYINMDYFNLDDIDDITTTFGRTNIKDNQVIWNLNGFKTGLDAELTIDINLNNDLIGKGGVYPISNGTDVVYKIGSINTLESSTKTPILKDNYTVTYDPNTPVGCVVSNVPSSKVYSVFDTVRVDDSVPTCVGYQFKEWKIVTDVEKFGNRQFVMPESNVVIKAIWKSVSLEKSMNGKISKAQTLYKLMADNSRGLDTKINFEQAPSALTSGIYTRSGTENDQYPVYYYRGSIENNNVVFAGFCWKMVRTTSTGGVKLVYNGVFSDDYENRIPIDQSKYINVVNDSSYPFVFDENMNKWTITNHSVPMVSTISFSVSDFGIYKLSYLGRLEVEHGKVYFYKDNVQIGVYSGSNSEDVISLGTLSSDNVITVKYENDRSSFSDSLEFSIDKMSGNVTKSCDNIGTNSQIGTSAFNKNTSSPASVGYMYGEEYKVNQYAIGYLYVLDQFSVSSDTNYYYGDTITYSNGVYTLNNALKKSWVDSYNNLTGYYTCNSDSVTCTTVYYVAGTDNSNSYLLPLTNGVVDPNSQTLTLGKSSIDNGDGTYTLTQTVTIKKVDWFKNYNTYNGYYVCNNSNSITCNSKYLVTYTNNYRLSYDRTYNFVYGNDIIWDGSQYTLTDTFVSTNSWIYDKANIFKKYHYTCLSTNNKCSKVYYINYFGKVAHVYYLTLSNGDDIDDVKEKSFTNTNDSEIKKVIDTWYRSNMLAYTNKLEDTIWCNDRSLVGGSLMGKDSNDNDSLSYFGAYKRAEIDYKPSLECPNVSRDGFTVSTTSGGNGALTYPVGLLTADEIRFAGGHGDSYYLYTGQYSRSLSPAYFSNDLAIVFYAAAGGSLRSYSFGATDSSFGVRPAISLIPGIRSVDGDGTVSNPYIID